MAPKPPDTITLEIDREVRAFGEGDDRTAILVGICSKSFETITLKGNAPPAEITPGLVYRFSGKFVEHEKYGRQFHFRSFSLVRPFGRRGLTKYLQQAPHIGPATASALYEAFGDKVFDAFRENPERVLAKAPRLNAKQVADIAKWMTDREAIEGATIELMDLLASISPPRKLIAQLIQKWGNSAVDRIRKNPLCLRQFHGVGFKRADRLYCELGLPLDSLERQALCMEHEIDKRSSETWIPVEEAIGSMRQAIASAHVRPHEAISYSINSDLLETKTVDGRTWIALKRRAEDERIVAENVLRLIDKIPEWPDMGDETDLTTHQRQAACNSMQAAVGCLVGTPGTGKAQPLYCKVLTPSGWKTMGEMQVGDCVLSPDGRPVRVKAVFPQGEKECFKVTMSDGSSTECCGEHLWFTSTTHERNKARESGVAIESVGSVRDTMEIAKTIRNDGGSMNHQIPMVGKLEFKEESLPLHPYIVGAMIRGGHSVGDSIYSIVYINEQLEKLGLRDCEDATKFIPLQYLFSSYKSRVQLLQGLIGPYGINGGRTIEYSTSSEQLSRDVVELVHSLGGTVVANRGISCTFDGERWIDLNYDRLHISLPNSVEAFLLPRNSQVMQNGTKYFPGRMVVSVESVGLRKCQCISVDSQDGLYVTDDYIVTHNTFTIARVARRIMEEHSASSLAICCPTGKAAVRVTEVMRQAGLHCGASTIHSLLGVASRDDDSFAFAHDETNPLPVKFVIIDEGSMNDIGITASLLRALPDDAHVLIVGDENQLPPVGHGAPLRDFRAAGVPFGELTEIRRNSGRIVEACNAMRETGQLIVSDKLDIAAGENLIFREQTSPELVSMELESILDMIERTKKYNLKWGVQILCAVNKNGVLSRKSLNARLQDRLNPDGARIANNPFRVGDKVICLKNGRFPFYEPDEEGGESDKAIVANGELGEVLHIEPRRTVVKLQNPDRTIIVPHGKIEKDDDEAGEQDGVAGQWDLGYAISCHKSQGSEFPLVLVIADDSPAAARVCDRSWVYTAISRAKIACVIIGRRATVEEWCRRASITRRKTMLPEYLNGTLNETIEPAGVAPAELVVDF